MFVCYSLLMCNTQRLALVHAEGARSLAVAVAFWAILLAVARPAVDLIHMNRNRGAVQVLPTHHYTHRQPHMLHIIVLHIPHMLLSTFMFR